MDTERQTCGHSDRVILWAVVLSLLLHGAVLAWVGINFPGLSRMVSVASPPPLRVKLNHQGFAATQKETTRAPVSESSTDKVSPVVRRDSPNTGPPARQSGWGLDMEQALDTEPLPTGPGLTDTVYNNLPNPEPEEPDLTSSGYAIQELDLSQDRPGSMQGRGAFADVLDPQVRRRLQLSGQNRIPAQPDLFQQVNNRTLSGGSQMMSFGDACFEVADAIGGRSREKMWLRTRCLGKTLSERMLDNVEKALETEQVEFP